MSDNKTMDVRLFIKRVKALHFRSYTLAATNDVGTSLHRVQLAQSQSRCVHFALISQAVGPKKFVSGNMAKK